MDEYTIYSRLLEAMFAIAVITAVTLFKITAPYGRHERKGWGLTLDERIGWIIMESPAFLVILICFIIGDRQTDPVAITFLVLWELHYVQRTFVFPFLLRKGEKKWPVVLVVFAIVFNTLNGYLNGRYLFFFAPTYPSDWFTDPRFITGVCLFVGGYVINRHSDMILRDLRGPGETGYKIPRGGFFRWVSCPNYFGEIVEWFGWALLTWSVAGLAFAVFTTANLLPRAAAHHTWYLKTFDSEYPDTRKRLIPFLY